MAGDTKGSVLEHLYNTLRQVSSEMSAGEFREIPYAGTLRVYTACSSQGSISALADALFEALTQRFDGFMRNDEHASTSWDGKAPGAGEFLLLLRCCIVLLRLLEFDLSLVMERCRLLLDIIRKVASSVDCLSSSGGDYDTTGNGLRCSLIEAFADELLVDRFLEKHVRMADHAFAISEKLFLPYRSFQGRCAIFELICVHFMLCVDENQFSPFHHSLFWTRSDDGKPEVGLKAAVILLDTVVEVSVPQILLAHVILLASRSIGISTSLNHTCTHVTSLVLSAFSHSVNLYGCSLHRLCLKHDIIEIGNWSNPMKWHTSESISRPSFAAYIRPATYCKVNDHILMLVNYLNDSSHASTYRTDMDELDKAMACVEENMHIIEQPHRTGLLTLLRYLISKIISRSTRTAMFNTSSREDIVCIAAILKLMSSSLLQIISALRGTDSSSKNTSQDFDSGKLYATISETVSSFIQYNRDLLLESVTSDVIELYPKSGEKTKLMIAHFIGLLIYAFDSGIDHLWKTSIYVIITLLNLHIYEDGSLDALRKMFGLPKESSLQASLHIVPFVSPLVTSSSSNISQDQGYRKSSSIIASNYQKTHMLLQEKTGNLMLGTLTYNETETHETLNGSHGILTTVVGTSLIATEAKKCRGQEFLACFDCKQEDFDDLADFIVCEKGKNYSTWFKKRARFRGGWIRSQLQKKTRNKYRKRYRQDEKSAGRGRCQRTT